MLLADFTTFGFLSSLGENSLIWMSTKQMRERYASFLSVWLLRPFALTRSVHIVLCCVHQSRDEKRYMDQKNKKARDQHRKEEVARIRQLVESAFERDPRV